MEERGEEEKGNAAEGRVNADWMAMRRRVNSSSRGGKELSLGCASFFLFAINRASYKTVVLCE